jgi:hypothetical protein
MVNYSNGKIYKIQHKSGEGQVYVGSTTKQYLSQRMDTHRNDYKQWKNGKIGLITSFNIFETYGIENCLITLLESVNANSKDELLAREAYWIKQLNCVNKFIPNRTRQEYYNDHKEKIVENKKQYYEKNKEKIAEHQKQYRQDNKEEILEKAKQYYDDHKEKLLENKKQYYEDNKEKIVETHKKYQQDNKEKIAEKARQTYICIACNTTLVLKCKLRHEKSKKHMINVDFSK